MARIKIEDLPENAEIGKESLRRIQGGNLNPYFSVALDGKGGDRSFFIPMPLLSKIEYLGKVSGPSPKLF
jgi:hypothetical protein